MERNIPEQVSSRYLDADGCIEPQLGPPPAVVSCISFCFYSMILALYVCSQTNKAAMIGYQTAMFSHPVC